MAKFTTPQSTNLFCLCNSIIKLARVNWLSINSIMLAVGVSLAAHQPTPKLSAARHPPPPPFTLPLQHVYLAKQDPALVERGDPLLEHAYGGHHENLCLPDTPTYHPPLPLQCA